ncbi:4-oxalocrotonate tautomerase [Phyllobacterium sp. SYP-B3895]|uniref:tautomerase family protein n=1 Tax=Phyllobacterium sp. SYP-B3895 TaxID=2663240 RepID=UPI001299FD81|nr:tautomerase family protein [Phyllobacterium sp. SYP-B3895]MRG57785.1 4-oxalocrotonate tautomerase [Phyllobacterium sp. SYP-B3895]
MPIMTVNYRDGDLDEVAKANLAQALTNVLIRMEGGADTQGGRAFAWVLFEKRALGDFWIGGAPGDSFISAPGPFLVHVTIPEGYMNGPHKSEVHAWVNQAIVDATGAAGRDDAGKSILVVIDEVPEGNWGCAGHTISMESISSSVGLAKTSQRYAWVEQYFAAKARMLTANDYPRDVGGVLPSMSREKDGSQAESIEHQG